MLKQNKQKRKEFQKQLFKANRLRSCSVMVLSVLGFAVNILISLLIKTLADYITGENDYALWQIVLCTVLVLGGFITVSLLRSRVKPKFVKKAMSQYKTHIFTELTKKNISSFSRENTGRYISALTNDAQTIEEYYLEITLQIVTYVMGGIIAISVMLYFNLILTVAAVVFAFVPLLASIAVGNRFAEKQVEVSEKNETFVSGVKDWLSGFSVVKSFQAEAEAIQCFDKINMDLESAKSDGDRMELVINMLTTIASLTSIFGVYFVGAVLAARGYGLTVGTIIVFANLMNMVNAPLTTVPQLWGYRKAACALMDKLAGLMQENIRNEGIRVPAELHAGIRMRDVSFSYVEGNPVLQGVTQQFEVGKSYAIVGESGSGKSTLLNVLMGGEDDYVGNIYFDNHELKDIDKDSIYDIVTLIQQNVFVFNDTIKHNITMLKDFPQEEIEKVIHMSGLDKLIEQKGNNYICGENGSGLSGGEKQRISIARALLKKASVLLVDEATAALDAVTSYEVTHALLSLSNVTRVVITHRLEEGLLELYDEILVMKNGRIIERGTFSGLMEKKAYFYSLFTITQKQIM